MPEQVDRPTRRSVSPFDPERLTMAWLSWLTSKRRSKAADTIDILSSAHKANVYLFYARLRAEAPVFATTLPDGQRAWLVTRYDDVAMVLKDERFAKDRSKASKPFWIPG